MKIVICMKETPSTTAEKRFGADMRLERRKEDAIINPFDEYSHRGGSAPAGEARRRDHRALHGASHRHRHHSQGAGDGRRPWRAGDRCGAVGLRRRGTARVLAAALQKIGFDLVLFGSAAADSYGGIVPSAVAEFLGLPLLSFATKLDIDGTTARIERAGRGRL